VDYALPTHEQILEAAVEALKHRRTVRSETALLKSVRASLRKIDPKFTVGRRRLRIVCLKSGKVEVTAFTRFTDERRPVSRCPVCSGPIAPIKNKTVYEGTVTLGYRCSVCGFWTGIKRRVPTLYVYVRRFGGTAEGEGSSRGLKIVDSRVAE